MDALAAHPWDARHRLTAAGDVGDDLGPQAPARSASDSENPLGGVARSSMSSKIWRRPKATFIVTGIVLLLTVASLARRSRSSHGRG